MAKTSSQKIGCWGSGSEKDTEVLDIDSVVQELNREFENTPERWNSMVIDAERGSAFLAGKTSLTLEELSKMIACSGVSISSFFDYHPQVGGSEKVIPVKEVWLRHMMTYFTDDRARRYLEQSIKIREMGIEAIIDKTIRKTIESFESHEGSVKIKANQPFFSGQDRIFYKETD